MGLLELLLGGPPNPTQLAFIKDPTFMKAYMGPKGVAKTSTLVGGCIMMGLFMPGAKIMISRRNYNDLKDTTMKRFVEMIDRLPPGMVLERNQEPPAKFYIRTAIPDHDGTEGFFQVTFMGLDDVMGSYEFNIAAVDEADQPEEQRVREIVGLLRLPKLHRSLMLAFNPPDMHHWLYPACTGMDAKGKRVLSEPEFKLFRPQLGENTRNLADGYFEQMAKSMPADMRRRLVEGEWGLVFEGQPVYREFAPKWHQRTGLMSKFNEHAVLLRFWDFGYNHPYCCFAQLDDEGRLLVFSEVVGEKEEARPFAERVKKQTRLLFPHARSVLDFGDPAVRQKKDTGQTLAQLAEVGITMLYTPNVGIDESVARVRLLLERNIRGEPAFQIAPEKAGVLCRALQGGYRMDKSGQRPLKDDFYDHGADALRYGIWNLFDLNGEMLPQPEPTHENGYVRGASSKGEMPEVWAYREDDDFLQ